MYTAQTSSSSVVTLLRAPSGLGELILRERRRRGWKQRQLADFCGVRTQTVSAWEQGNPPQRRFFAKIAEFLGVRNVEEIAVLVPGKSASDGEQPSPEQAASAPTADLQTHAVETILRQLDMGGRPTNAEVKLYRELLDASKQSAGRRSKELVSETAGTESEDPRTVISSDPARVGVVGY